MVADVNLGCCVQNSASLAQLVQGTGAADSALDMTFSAASPNASTLTDGGPDTTTRKLNRQYVTCCSKTRICRRWRGGKEMLKNVLVAEGY